MERIQIVILGLCLLLLVQIVLSVRREHIRVEYSMAWFGACLLLLALSLWEDGLRWLGQWMQIEDSATLLLLVAAILFLFTFFRFSVVVSGLKDNNIVLAQKVGTLEWEVRKQAEQLARINVRNAESKR